MPARRGNKDSVNFVEFLSLMERLLAANFGGMATLGKTAGDLVPNRLEQSAWITALKQNSLQSRVCPRKLYQEHVTPCKLRFQASAPVHITELPR